MNRKEGSKPFVSVIIPAKNEGSYIGQCLESIHQQNYPEDRYEIIVVDNGSIDNTYQIASRVANKAYIRTGIAVGGVRNYGVSKASGEVLAFLDGDCVAPKDWLIKGIERLIESPQAAIGGGIKNPDNATWVEKSWILEGENSGTVPKELIGANFFISRDDFLSLGGFNEEITSGEDSDLSMRARAAGLKIFITPENKVIHLGNAKSIIAFMRRQIWHSENYISKIGQSLVDPVFYVTLAFLFGLVSIPIGLMSFSLLISLGLVLVVFLPIILTIKRIIRSKGCVKNPINIFLFYIMDFVYLLSRSIGLVRGIRKIKYFTNSKNKGVNI